MLNILRRWNWGTGWMVSDSDDTADHSNDPASPHCAAQTSTFSDFPFSYFPFLFFLIFSIQILICWWSWTLTLLRRVNCNESKGCQRESHWGKTLLKKSQNVFYISIDLIYHIKTWGVIVPASSSSGLMKNIIIRIINWLMTARWFVDEDDEDKEDGDDDCQSRRISPSSV